MTTNHRFTRCPFCNHIISISEDEKRYTYHNEEVVLIKHDNCTARRTKHFIAKPVNDIAYNYLCDRVTVDFANKYMKEIIDRFIEHFDIMYNPKASSMDMQFKIYEEMISNYPEEEDLWMRTHIIVCELWRYFKCEATFPTEVMKYIKMQQLKS